MTELTDNQRREIAHFCFEPHLSSDELTKAILLLDEGYQTNSISKLIKYISRVCAEYGIGDKTRKDLYSQFHELMANYVEANGKTTTFSHLNLSTNQTSLTVTNPSPTQYSVDEVNNEPTITPPHIETINAETVVADKTPPSPIHVVVFSHFMGRIIRDLQPDSDFFEILGDMVKDVRQYHREISIAMIRWTENPNDYRWADGLDEKTLSKIVHLVYTALCEIMGPISTDNMFHKAIDFTEQQPEAKLYAPTRFL